MATEFLDVRLYAPHSGTSDAVADLLRRCGRAFDLTDNDLETMRCFDPDAADELPSRIPIAEAIERVSSARSGALWFRVDDIEFGVHVHPDTDGPATFTVSVADYYVRIGRDSVRTIVDEIVVPLYEYVSPMFVYTGYRRKPTTLVVG